MKQNKGQKAFTLVEILLVVGFISLASIGIYVIFTQARAASSANQEAELLNNAISRIERATNASGVFTEWIWRL